MIGVVSIAAAALCMAIGSIGPALGEAKAIAQALSSIAQQPDEAGTISRTLVHRTGDDRIDRDLLLRDRDHPDFRQSVLEPCDRASARKLAMLIDWFTVVAQIVNFLVLVALLKHFLYGRLVEAIDAREKRIAARLAEADEKGSGSRAPVRADARWMPSKGSTSASRCSPTPARKPTTSATQ